MTPTRRSPTPRRCATDSAATVDVATLDQWLERSGDYDVALRALYDAVRRGASTDHDP